MEQKKIRLKVFPSGKAPEQAESGDWVDLYSAETVQLKQGEYRLIRLGIAMELPDGYEALVAPRSSTFKTWGILQANSMGVIDENYKGDNDEWRMPVYATRDTRIEQGDKLCQFRIIEHQPNIIFEQVDKLGNEDRGGFGTTGKV